MHCDTASENFQNRERACRLINAVFWKGFMCLDIGVLRFLSGHKNEITSNRSFETGRCFVLPRCLLIVFPSRQFPSLSLWVVWILSDCIVQGLGALGQINKVCSARGITRTGLVNAVAIQLIFYHMTIACLAKSAH
jgi:hypothetical protein